jgi:membrane associated rhomboid family serine protease
MQMGFRRITPMVKKLLIVNIVVFVLSIFMRRFMFDWFSVFPETLWMTLQLWRPVTYQFLHADIWHIFFNMLVLFFFGPMLEQLWGSRKFLIFYLVCGAAGGLFYPLLALTGWLDVGPLVGASGSILGMLAAGAILFPNMRVYIWGILPVKLMFLAMALAAVSIMTLLSPARFANAGGQAAHLAGMAAGAVYVLSERWRARVMTKFQSRRWESQMAVNRRLQFEVDRILQKVHDSGIHSLTRREKKILKKATEAERIRNEV